MTICSRTTFDKIPNDIIIMVEFWCHSLCCALASERIAEAVDHPKKAVLFTVGLIHDIGKLAMFSQIPDACLEQAVLVTTGGQSEEGIGLNRSEIGSIRVRDA